MNLCKFLSGMKVIQDYVSVDAGLRNTWSSTGFVTEQEKLQTYCIKNKIPFKFESKIEMIQEVRDLLTASNYKPHEAALTMNAGRPMNKRN